MKYLKVWQRGMTVAIDELNQVAIRLRGGVSRFTLQAA